jgi:predicted phosphodiesterase
MKILVIADVHGNAEALAAVLEKERDVDATIFLGDTVLSGPQPNETMALLGGVDGVLIEGNHDVEMFEPERFEGWPAPWRAYTNWILETLEPAGWELLRALQPEGEYEVGGQRVFLHHGVLPDEPRQALPDTAALRPAGCLLRGDRGRRVSPLPGGVRPRSVVGGA